jgi:GMP synthase (glutamine-hydrolysing)
MIVIIDNGSQYTYLIEKLLKNLTIECLVSKTFDYSLQNVNGIILSGGNGSVNAIDFEYDNKIFELNIPVLGICMGLQIIVKHFGGSIETDSNGEYGNRMVAISDYKNTKLFHNLEAEKYEVLMSHNDFLSKLPVDFKVTSVSDKNQISSIEHVSKNIFGVQFHAETSQETFSNQFFTNFLQICKIDTNNIKTVFETESLVQKWKVKIGNEKVLLALSGGVDSTILAILLHKAIGKNLYCVSIDTGLIRDSEFDFIKTIPDLNLEIIDAKHEFITALANISDPEQKRKIIGKQFIKVFNRVKTNYGYVKYLAQGTIKSDVIESGGGKDNKEVIKSHHNVGGLPADIGFEIIEPFREYFKDEIKKIGANWLPLEVIHKQPFPGVGFAVRIIGDITNEKLNILKKADSILLEELIDSGQYYQNNQSFVVLTPIKTVGVKGDDRTYSFVVVIRIVDSVDFMTASFSRISFELLDKISKRITDEVKEISRVCYDITSKPPATIEWE